MPDNGFANAMTCSCLLLEDVPLTFTMHRRNHVTLTLQWQKYIFPF